MWSPKQDSLPRINSGPKGQLNFKWRSGINNKGLGTLFFSCRFLERNDRYPPKKKRSWKYKLRYLTWFRDFTPGMLICTKFTFLLSTEFKKNYSCIIKDEQWLTCEDLSDGGGVRRKRYILLKRNALWSYLPFNHCAEFANCDMNSLGANISQYLSNVDVRS